MGIARKELVESIISVLSSEPIGINEVMRKSGVGRGMANLTLTKLVMEGRVKERMQTLAHYTRIGYYVGATKEDDPPATSLLEILGHIERLAKGNAEIETLVKQGLDKVRKEKSASICVSVGCKNGNHKLCLGRCTKCNTTCRCSCHD